ncbi:MAG TPA: DUF6265 family protein [Steroidobacteraceae bacterium]|jgi:hypothetical protein
MPRHWTGGLVFAALLPATAGAGCDSLESLRWLLGDWVADGGQTSFHESWRELGPRDWQGTGIERSKTDNAVKGAEDLRLVEMGGSVFYVSKVTHNELPVAFRLTSCADGAFLFENAAHDFPRRLDYRQGGGDALSVRVSDGADKGFTLEFRRAAAPAPAAVLAAEDARFAAMIAADAPAMERWLAADLVYAHTTGLVQDRTQLMATIADGRTRYIAIAPAEREVVALGPDAAFVRGLGRFRVAAGQTPMDMQARYLAVYVLRDGRWQLRAWQSLRIP